MHMTSTGAKEQEGVAQTNKVCGCTREPEENRGQGKLRNIEKKLERWRP